MSAAEWLTSDAVTEALGRIQRETETEGEAETATARPWIIKMLIDGNGTEEWFVFDAEQCPRAWFTTEREAQAWLKRQHPVRCAECGTSRGQWEIEESLNPQGHPCCDEPIKAPPASALASQTVCRKLLVLPDAIARAEEAVLAAEREQRRAERRLQRCQDGLLLDGAIDGKNEAVRAAQLRTLTAGAAAHEEHAAETASQAKITLRLLQNQLASLRAVARLLAGAE